MESRRRLIRNISVALAAVCLAAVCLWHRFPVLLHFAGSCACTDYSAEVEGAAVFNPLRDTAAETAAAQFLEDLRQGRCPTTAKGPVRSEVCSMRGGVPPARKWRLEFRRDTPGRVSLYYKFDRTPDDLAPQFGGEGMVALDQSKGAWNVAAYDIVW